MEQVDAFAAKRGSFAETQAAPSRDEDHGAVPLGDGARECLVLSDSRDGLFMDRLFGGTFDLDRAPGDAAVVNGGPYYAGHEAVSLRRGTGQLQSERPVPGDHLAVGDCRQLARAEGRAYVRSQQVPVKLDCARPQVALVREPLVSKLAERDLSGSGSDPLASKDVRLFRGQERQGIGFGRECLSSGVALTFVPVAGLPTTGWELAHASEVAPSGHRPFAHAARTTI